MVNKNLSHGLWNKTAPPLKKFDSLQGEAKTDVAVIGGGYTGLSAALHLAEDGAETTLLEANHIGFGGAGRNVGLVNAGLWVMPSEVVQKLGSDCGEELIRVLGASPDLVFKLIEENNIQCEAVRAGTLHCAHSKGGLRNLEQREAEWQKRGAPVTLLSKDEASPLIGTSAYHGALLDKRAGTVQPLAYAHGLATAADEKGARIYGDSPVTSIERIGNGWKLKTPNGVLLAKAVILAVQGYADHAFKDMEAKLIPFNYFQFSTPPLSEEILETILPGKHGAWDTNLVLSSYRLDQTGRLIVGSVGQVDNWGFTLHENWAKRTIQRVFPQIGATEFEHGWYGRIAMTPDHLPRFHILGPDFITVTTYNGRGIGPGSVFGKLLAKYIQDDSSVNIPLPQTKPQQIFLRGLRGLYYEAGARIYHMAQRRTGLF